MEVFLSLMMNCIVKIYINMKKLLKDRLNHLKSDLAQLKNKKMDKNIDSSRIIELSIRINEVKYLITKL